MIQGSRAKRAGLMGDKQPGFSDYKLTIAQKQVKRDRLLSEMEIRSSSQELIM
jgi:hypothetical protein